MTTRTITVDVVTEAAGDGALARVFGDTELAGAASSAEAAVAALERLLVHLADEAPWRVLALEAAGRVSPVALAMTVPVLVGERIETIAVSVVGAQREASPGAEATAAGGQRRVEVFLPHLDLVFDVSSADQLDQAATQHFCSQHGLGERLAALRAYLVEPPSADDLGLRQITVEVEAAETADDADEAEQYPVLSAVGEALHRRLADKDAPRAFERGAAVDRLLALLVEPGANSVLVVGPAGVGKTAVVQEVVGRMIRGEVPEPLGERPVWQISGGRIMAGMRFLGQWQERVMAIIAEVRAAGGILFADDLTELMESTGNEQHSQGILGMLSPFLAAGELTFVTEATDEQLARIEQRSASLLGPFRRLSLEPMDATATDAVLERVSFRLGRQHGVRLSAAAREKILDLALRFGGGALPGPAVDLAERMARAQADQALAVEGRGERPELQPADALEVFAAQSGLPRELLDPSVAFDVASIAAFFGERIFDQPDALEAMVDLVTVIRAGLNPTDRPLGSYLFVGPTGVGKTQTALTLAEYLFGSQDRLVRFDMSEFQDPWSAARLVGRTRGERGELVRRLREQPFQVVLLDEIEKAHPSVYDLLLQVLGEGRLTGALGQTVSATGAVVIMTSNLGSEGPSSLGFGAGEHDPAAERRHYASAVADHFRPEFVGRVDRTVTFGSLGRKTASRLVRRALDEAFGREGLRRRRLSVDVEPAVVDYLIGIGFDPRYGARPLRQAVENHITAPLAHYLARHPDLSDVALRFAMVDGVPEVVEG